MATLVDVGELLRTGWCLRRRASLVRGTRAVEEPIADSVKRQVGASAVTSALGISVLELSADLDGVIALNGGEVFLPVVAGVRPGDDWIALDASYQRIP